MQVFVHRAGVERTALNLKASARYRGPGRRTTLPCHAAASASGGPSDQPSSSGSSAGGDAGPWWSKINRKQGLAGPLGPQKPPPAISLERQLVGDRALDRVERLRKDERQRGACVFWGAHISPTRSGCTSGRQWWGCRMRLLAGHCIGTPVSCLRTCSRHAHVFGMRARTCVGTSPPAASCAVGAVGGVVTGGGYTACASPLSRRLAPPP